MIAEMLWSEVQRDPKEVARLADQGDVRLRRRDGVPLLLTREDRAAASAAGAVAVARAVRQLARHLPPNELAETLAEEFTWLDLLPEKGRQEFAAEFVRTLSTAAETGVWALLDQMLHEWKATAAIYADPELLAELTNPIVGDLGPVPSPERPDDVEAW